jgi:hypothetical protein
VEEDEVWRRRVRDGGWERDANLNSLIGGQSCSPVMRMFASIHFLPPSTSCLHPLPASIHFGVASPALAPELRPVGESVFVEGLELAQREQGTGLCSQRRFPSVSELPTSGHDQRRLASVAAFCD